MKRFGKGSWCQIGSLEPCLVWLNPALWRQENCKLEENLGCSTVDSRTTWAMHQDGGNGLVFRTGNLTHISHLLTACNSHSRASDAFFWLSWAHKHSYAYMFFKKKKFFLKIFKGVANHFIFTKCSLSRALSSRRWRLSGGQELRMWAI